MRIFTVTRYYIEDGMPVEEKTTYMHAGTIIERDGERFGVATDRRAVPLSASLLRTAAAESVEPNLWFAFQITDSACPVLEALHEHTGVCPPGHWFWNPIDLGPKRVGVMFVDKGEYDEHVAHMAAKAAN